MSRAAAFTIILVAGLLATHTVDAEFVLGFLPTNNLTGYTLATLADIHSPEFFTQYNDEGISFVQPFPNGVFCCLISVSEGYLSFGSSATNSNFLEPFANGQDKCTSNTQLLNATFGVPTFFPPPYNGLWLSTISAKEQRSLIVTSNTPPYAYTASCPTIRNATSSTYPAIFKKSDQAQFVIRPQGPNYPAPAGYQEMSVEDMRSDVFQTHYNSVGGVLLTGVSSTNYCCLIRVADGGWLSYGPEGLFAPLSLLEPPSGMWQCGLATNNQIHWLGTAFGGSLSVVLESLNSTSVNEFGYFINNTADWDGCQGLPDTLTIYKKSS